MHQDLRFREMVRNRWLLLAAGFLALLILLGVASAPTAADVVQITPLPPVENPDGRAGACYSFYHDPPESSDRPYISLAYDVGSRWDRFDFIWPNLQQHNGDWKDEGRQAYDDLVNDLRAVPINIVGILLWTPDWAATSGTSSLSTPHSEERPPGWYVPEPRSDARLIPQAPLGASSSPPQGLYEEWDDWTDTDGDSVNYWGRFVHKVVSHYGDRVKHWEMWNEPEWTYFWTGTSTDYAQLLKVGYQATKAACPDCTVLFGGLHYWENRSYYRWVLNILNRDPEAPGNNYFFDVMSVHFYSRSSNVYDEVESIRDGMRVYNVGDHPIWLTETGVPVWGDQDVPDYIPNIPKYKYAATLDEAAAYAIQSYANAWAAEVERYFFFRTSDDWCDKNRDGDCDDEDIDGGMTELFGLVRDNRTLRPAYVAYQVATTYLISPTMATRVACPDDTRQVTLWGTPRGKVSVLWNTTPISNTFQYTATLPSATLVDRWGVTQTITATGGVYTLTLPGATANLVDDPDDPDDSDDPSDYFIGGEPYLVIEADTEDPSAPSVQPLPTTTYSYTVAISCTAHDDVAGIWGHQLQWREEGENPWVDWPGFHSAPIVFTDGQHGRTYCFRVRAWDRAGNHSEWVDVEPCTTLDWDREVRFQLGSVFGDENGNGVKDGDEVKLTDVSLRFVDAAGADVVSPTVGSSWAFTKTLMAGEYTLIVEPSGWPSLPPGWLPRRDSVVIEPGEPAEEIDREIGLLPHRSSAFLPIIARGN